MKRPAEDAAEREVRRIIAANRPQLVCRCEECIPTSRPIIKCPWRLRGHWVYYALDVNGAPLYIGCTSDLKQRRSAHKVGSEWFPLTVRFRVRGPFTRESALRIEREAIAEHLPRFNKMGKPRRPVLEVVA